MDLPVHLTELIFQRSMSVHPEKMQADIQQCLLRIQRVQWMEPEGIL